MLEWLDGRNGSSFGNIAYSGGQLTFSLVGEVEARGLEAMLPARSASGPLSKLTPQRRRRSRGRASDQGRRLRGVRRRDRQLHGHVRQRHHRARDHECHRPPRTARATRPSSGPPTSRRPRSSSTAARRRSAYEQEQTAEVTDHSVELTGLVPGDDLLASASARPTPRATPARRRRRLARSPRPPGGLVDSRRSDFGAGTASGTCGGDTLDGPDGEVQLQPTIGDEFDGPGLSGQWTASPVAPRRRRPRSSAAPSCADTAVAYTPDYYAGRAYARVHRDVPAGERPGGRLLGNDLSDFPIAIFTLRHVRRAVQASTPRAAADPGNAIETPLPNVSLNVPHRFRIEWTPDGHPTTTSTARSWRRTTWQSANEMRPIVSDYGMFGAERPGALAAHGDVPDVGHVHLTPARQRPGRQRLAAR